VFEVECWKKKARKRKILQTGNILTTSMEVGKIKNLFKGTNKKKIMT